MSVESWQGGFLLLLATFLVQRKFPGLLQKPSSQVEICVRPSGRAVNA